MCPLVQGIEIDEESDLYVPILIQSYARDSEETIIAITCKTTNLMQIHSEGKRSSIHVSRKSNCHLLQIFPSCGYFLMLSKKKNYVVTYLVASETVLIV